MAQTKEYTAEDGLAVLDYLGLTNITAKEEAVFREKWNEVYKSNNKSIVMTTWTLYSEVLPFTCGDGDRGSFMVHQLRDSDFGQRLETTTLENDLKKGAKLEDILKAKGIDFKKVGRV